MNRVKLVGFLTQLLKFDTHTTGIIEVVRQSGVIDEIPFEVNYADPPVAIGGGQVLIQGRVSTRNYTDDNGRGHKHIFVTADLIQHTIELEDNAVIMAGTLVKKDVIRTTPKGKVIMDAVIAVPDGDGSSYPSVIAWGATAHMLNAMPIGAKLMVEGRFQSRDYWKRVGETKVLKRAREISISKMWRKQ